MKKVPMLLLLSILAGTSVAAAQDFGHVTVFASGSFLAGERTFVTEDPDEVFRTDYQTGAKVGFRYTVDLDDYWAGEASYSLGRNSLRVNELDQPNTFSVFEINLHQINLNALYYLAPLGQDTRGFVTFGLGMTRFSPTDQAQANAVQNLFDDSAVIDGSTKWGVNFGGGVESRMSDRMGLRFDLRDHVMPIPRYGLPETQEAPGDAFYPVDGSVHNFEASVGLLFYLR